MSVTCYLQHGGKGDQIVRMFAQGCNGKVVDNEEFLSGKMPDADKPVFLWSYLRGNNLILDYCIENNHPYYYADNSYFYNKEYFRITLNSLQNSKFVKRPADRFNKMPIKITEWTRKGSHILICPPTDAFIKRFKKENWLDDTIGKLKKYTDREIRVRKKPNEFKMFYDDRGRMTHAGEKLNSHIKSSTLEQDLQNCWAVVAFQSAVVNDAIAAGIPAFVDNFNAAYIMGNTDLTNIETPVYMDQQEYFNHLAYCQFTRQEMADGTAWSILNGTR